MTYLKFTLWLCGLYFIYYTIIILSDILKASRGSVRQDIHELTFAESFIPVRPEPEMSMDEIQSPVIASGGVSLKMLFNLAREEKVEYTSQVSF